MNLLEITSQADSQLQNLNVKKTWFHFSNADQKKLNFSKRMTLTIQS